MQVMTSTTMHCHTMIYRQYDFTRKHLMRGSAELKVHSRELALRFISLTKRTEYTSSTSLKEIQGKQRQLEEVENSINWVLFGLNIRPCDDA